MRTTIEMAREAGIRDCTCDGTLGCLERFASLVRADERARMAEQPAQQKPVAWMHEWIDGEKIPLLRGRDGRKEDQPKTVRPLVYGDTSPPAQRTWVGLTEEERNDLEDYCEMIIGKAAFDAIEDKLKEKNT